MTDAVRDKVRGNLRDAGCDEAEIAACLAALERGCRQRALTLMEGHRQKLLDRYHRCKTSIDCLDYLMVQLEKGEKSHGTDGEKEL